MFQSQNISELCCLHQSPLGSSGSQRFGIFFKSHVLFEYAMRSQLCSWPGAPRHHPLVTFLYSACLCKYNNVGITDSVCARAWEEDENNVKWKEEGANMLLARDREQAGMCISNAFIVTKKCDFAQINIQPWTLFPHPSLLQFNSTI